MQLIEVNRDADKIAIDVVRMEDGTEVYRLTVPYRGGKSIREAFKERLFPGKKGYWDSRAKQWVTSNDAINLEELIAMIQDNIKGNVKPEINYRDESNYEVKSGPLEMHVILNGPLVRLHIWVMNIILLWYLTKPLRNRF